MSLSPELKPYISVTGVTNLAEAKFIASAFRNAMGYNHSHQGAVGYLANLESLNRFNLENLKRPDLSTLPTLLSETEKDAVNIIHYNTRQPKTLAEQVVRLFTETNIYNDSLSQTVQLNTRWPDIGQVQEIKNCLPELRIILAVGGKVLRTQSREEIINKLGDYQSLINVILIDPSGGNQRRFEAGWVAPYIRSIRNSFPDKQIALAGGFNAEGITQRLSEITYAIWDDNFSIDAESGLRDTSKHPYGTLSLSKAALYIEKAAAFFSN